MSILTTVLGFVVVVHVGQPPPDALDLILPGKQERLRIQDDDGSLSGEEAARILPIPLPSNRSVRFDFAKADANSDGKVSLAEFKAFYHTAGFQPILTVIEPLTLEDMQVADALFSHLVPKGADQLTPAALKKAYDLLRKLDENEDELLTVAEILSLGNLSTRIPKESEFQWSAVGKQQVRARLQLKFDDKALSVRAEPKSLSLTGGRLMVANAVLEFSTSRSDPLHGMKNSRRFVLAQFEIAAGNAHHVERRQVKDDAALQVLEDLFPHVDRDGNGKLTRTELERFLDLIEQGIAAPLLVSLRDRGRNLFCHLDGDGDGVLSGKELRRAPEVFRLLGGDKGWQRNGVPAFAQVRIQQGFADRSFGPLPLPAPAQSAPPTPAGKEGKGGPAWFQAMDRNGDGLLSPREFLGPIEVFRNLDRDGDGFISIAEAEEVAR
jgi:Ca2+-binding EF-hand superfamily protein